MPSPFTHLLLKWNREKNHRPMPWKGEKDPYKIWLSEIILQQTRVEQGWAYYEKFLKNFPTIFQLAAAKDEKVFKLWEGLGYYNRCKNLLFTARQIVKEFKGKFPNSYEDLLLLKGVGPYTASAIASFAYNLPHAVVDGNVFRVFSRFYGIATPIDTKEGIAIFNKIAFENLSKTQAGIYNQALMDFGATICKPMAAQCPSCVMQKKCKAFTQNQVNLLPVKLKSIQKKNRFFDFFIFKYEDQFLIQKRGDGDIWSNLFQFYLIENERVATIDKKYIQKFILEPLAIASKNIISLLPSTVYKQTLTHQQIEARFIIIQLDKKPALFAKALWVKKEGFKKYPFPKIVNDFLKMALAKGKSGFSL
jgi:A/G-specific adenine glycosylase